MVRVLLVTAASLAALVATPAFAEHRSDGGFPRAVSGVNVHRGSAFIVGRFRHDDCDRHDRRCRRDFDDGSFFSPYYSYDFDGNRQFDPDRWNDWWHERPWRAYPRWVQNNRDCDPSRMWQGGGVWRCSW